MIKIDVTTSRTIIGACLASILCGCVTSRSEDFRGSFRGVPAPEKKSIVYSFRTTSTSSQSKDFNAYTTASIGTGAWVPPQEDGAALRQFAEVFSPVAESLKRTYASGLEDGDVFIELHQQSTFNMAGAIFGGLVCGATLMIVPCWGDDVYYLHAKASNRDGLKREYLIRRDLTCTTWLPLVLAMPFSEMPWTARNCITMENWKELLARMEADGFFGAETGIETSCGKIKSESESQSNCAKTVKESGVDLREFFNIRFFQDLSAQMKSFGILSVETDWPEIKRYNLGREYDKVHKDLPGSRRFMGFRPHALLAKKSGDALVGILASDARSVVGRDKMSARADKIIKEVNRIIANDGDPKHVGKDKVHRWEWAAKDNSGKDIKILMFATTDSAIEDRWFFHLSILSIENGDLVSVDPNGVAHTSGTGWFVSKDKIVTCNHVVEDAVRINIETADGKICEARVVQANKERDLAVLTINGYESSAVLPVSTTLAKISTHVFTIGYPIPGLLGSECKYTDGTISSASGIGGDKTHYQISVPIQPGNSGGALVNEDGVVVGVTSSALDEIRTALAIGTLPQNVNYAIKSRYVVEMLEDAGVAFSTALQGVDHSKVVDLVGKATVLLKVEKK